MITWLCINCFTLCSIITCRILSSFCHVSPAPPQTCQALSHLLSWNLHPTLYCQPSPTSLTLSISPPSLSPLPPLLIHQDKCHPSVLTSQGGLMSLSLLGKLSLLSAPTAPSLSWHWQLLHYGDLFVPPPLRNTSLGSAALTSVMFLLYCQGSADAL